MKKHLLALGFLCTYFSTFAQEYPSIDAIDYTKHFDTAEFIAPSEYTLQDRFASGTFASIKFDSVMFNEKAQLMQA